MKLRKLFAGIAAAATVLGGMTLGAASASADEKEYIPEGCFIQLPIGTAVTITGNKSQLTKSDGEVRDYGYVKLADLTAEGMWGRQSLKLTTVNKLSGLLQEKLQSVSNDYDGKSDPIKWLGDKQAAIDYDSVTRQFADLLEKATSDSMMSPSLELENDVKPVLSEDGASVTLDFGENGAGVYLIVDKSGDQNHDGTIYHASKAMLLSTKVVTSGSGCTINGNTSGEVNVKSEDSESPDFHFKKIDAKTGEGIAGAEFKIYEGEQENGRELYFTTDDGGTYTFAQKGTSGASVTLTTPEGGSVTVKGLDSDKTYVVVETSPAAGYLNYTASFTIKNYASVWSIETENDPWDLANRNGAVVEVKNVKTITQLPFTGAAGTILFSVVGVLFAGVAAMVYVRSRRSKRLLEA